jgi:hypothetical protein
MTNDIEKRLANQVINICKEKQSEPRVNAAYLKYERFAQNVEGGRDANLHCNVNEAYTDYKIWKYLNKKGLD